MQQSRLRVLTASILNWALGLHRHSLLRHEAAAMKRTMLAEQAVRDQETVVKFEQDWQEALSDAALDAAIEENALSQQIWAELNSLPTQYSTRRAPPPQGTIAQVIDKRK